MTRLAYRPRGGAVAWLVTLAAPVVLYLILRVGIAALAGPGVVEPSLLPPRDYQPLAKQVTRSIHLQNKAADAEVMRIAEKAILSSPLSHEPFIIAAKVAQGHGRRARAIELLNEAKSRRPGRATTRLLLADLYAREGSAKLALNELDAALRLSEQARVAVLPALTGLMKSKDGREALAEVIAREPEWRLDFLQTASGQKLNAIHSVDFFKMVARKKRGRNIAPEQRFIIQSLLAAGEYRRARDIWIGSVAERSRGKLGLITDGDFTASGSSSPGAAEPFGWQLHELDVGRADIESQGGESYLQATYFGGRNAVLAEQTLVVPPGSYQLQLLAKTSTESKPGVFNWTIACLPDRQELGMLKLDKLRPDYALISAPFKVPARGCSAQNITLFAEAGEVASETDLQVKNIAIVPQ